MAFDLSHADALAEVETLRQELAEARADRVWEANRANEAARLSAEARDQADDLRREIEKLNEHVTIVEGDRTDNDRWAVNLVVEFDLDPNHAVDPYQAVARGLREWRQHVLDAEAKLEAMVRIRAEAKAASAERDAMRPVVEAAKAWRANVKAWGPPLRKMPGSIAGAEELIAAVDALPTKDGA